jgi:hypothetical protein
VEDKLRVPLIEKQNGNISINCMRGETDPEKVKGSYRVAIAFYNKSLFALKCLFDNRESPIIDSPQKAADLIFNVEIPVCLNLALCYIKMEEWHFAIRYAK